MRVRLQSNLIRGSFQDDHFLYTTVMPWVTNSTVHFVTFTCFRRRRLLDTDVPRLIVIDNLEKLRYRHNACCLGFVVMPNHVHATLWLPPKQKLNIFIQQWKRLSSFQIKRWYLSQQFSYANQFNHQTAFWQAGYCAFPIKSESKLFEKLQYMHDNPVRAKLVKQSTDWRFGSARWEHLGEDVGVNMGWIKS